MQRQRPAPANGFTLIELMIVVAIIGILSAIAITQFAQLLEKSRIGNTKDSLANLRSAAAIYYSDNSGTWPTTLSTANGYFFSAYLDQIKPVTAQQNQTGARIGPGSQSGGTVTYDNTDAVPIAPGYGWFYNTTLGKIYVNSNDSDLSKFPFTCY